jgi:hypothetical protein
MTKKRVYRDYSGYSFEDFLSDDFFISSINHPTPETSAFWEQFRQENESFRTRSRNAGVYDTVHSFDAARAYLEALNRYYSSLSQDDMDEMKRNILLRKDGKTKSLKRQRQYANPAELSLPDRKSGSLNKWRLYGMASAAASIAILIVFALSYTKNREVSPDTTDIRSFVDGQAAPEVRTKEIQLILSSEKTLTIDQEETEITYDTTGIQIRNSGRIMNTETASFNQLIVPVGKRSVLNLSDGSKICVNAGSRLVYPVTFDSEIREIYVDGEIFIDVAPEEKRPFTVRTRNMDIRVMGTQFNVTAYETDHEEKVVLVSGSVQITSKENNGKTNLLPNQMYMSENGHNHVEQVDTKNYTSWVDGCYYCENESLGSILNRLSRYYGIEITCEQAISRVIFSGKLDLKENLSDIFDGIAFTLPVTYRENDGAYIISPAR